MHFNEAIEEILYWDRDYDLAYRKWKPDEKVVSEDWVERWATRFFNLAARVLPIDVCQDNQYGYVYRFHDPKKSRWLGYLFFWLRKKRKEKIPQKHTTITSKSNVLPPSPCPIITDCWLFIMFYTFLLTLVMTYTWFNFDGRLIKWWPQVREGANRTNLCAFEHDIVQPDQQLYEELRGFRIWLFRTIGLRSSLHNIMVPVFLSGCIYITVSFMSAYLVCNARQMTFDCKIHQFMQYHAQVLENVRIKSKMYLSDVANLKAHFYGKAPMINVNIKPKFDMNYRALERGLASRDLVGSGSITTSHTTSMASYTGYNKLWRCYCNKKQEFGVDARNELITSQIHRLDHIFGNNLQIDSTSHHTKEIQSQDSYESEYSHLASLVMPGPASYRYRRYYSIVRFLAFVYMLPMCNAIHSLGNWMMLSEEVRVTLQAAKTIKQCKCWHPDSVPIRDVNFYTHEDKENLIAELESYDQPLDEWTFEAFNTNNKLRLSTYLVKFTSTPMLYFLWTHINGVVFHTAIWLCFNTAHMFDCYMMKNIWSKSLQKKMQNCILALQLLRAMESDVGQYDNIRGFSHKYDSDTFIFDANIKLVFEKQYKQIESAILVILCDFDLFCKARVYYRNFNIYFGLICCVALASITVLLYTLYVKLDSHKNIFVVSLMMLTVGMADIYFYLNVETTRCYQMVYSQLIYLMANIQQPFYDRQKHLVEILKRNLLYDELVQTLYATNLFGIHITRSKVININTYTIGAIIYFAMSRVR